MKKVVLKVNIQDHKDKQKAMKAVSSIPGIDSISLNMKEGKLTVNMKEGKLTVSKVRKQWEVVSKVRKQWEADILTFVCHYKRHDTWISASLPKNGNDFPTCFIQYNQKWQVL